MPLDRPAFDHLSPQERGMVGEPEDYDWEDPMELPARARPDTVQFSLRVERSLLGQLQQMARRSNTTVSDLARTALERYVTSGGMPAVANLHVSFGSDRPNDRTKFLVQDASGRPQLGATGVSGEFQLPAELAGSGQRQP